MAKPAKPKDGSTPSDRARRSRSRRAAEGARRIDLILSARAGRAADSLAMWLGCSLTAAVENAVVAEWRRTGDRKSRSRDRKLQRAVQSARTKAWYHFVRLSVGERKQAGVARRVGRESAGGGGSLGKYARGDVAVSAGSLNFYERVAPGSAQAYRSGPFGSKLWSVLTTESISDLWPIVEEHVPVVAQLRRDNKPFSSIAAALVDEARRTPTSVVLPGDWSWGTVAPPISSVPHGRDPQSNSLNPYCLASALLAALRLAGLGYHPAEVESLRSVTSERLIGGLRGAHSLLSSANSLDSLLDTINEGVLFSRPEPSLSALIERIRSSSSKASGA
jgi:hypothetical protein